MVLKFAVDGNVFNFEIRNSNFYTSQSSLYNHLNIQNFSFSVDNDIISNNELGGILACCYISTFARLIANMQPFFLHSNCYVYNHCSEKG